MHTQAVEYTRAEGYLIRTGDDRATRTNVPLSERQLGAHLSRHGISLPVHGSRYTQTIKIGETTEGNGTTIGAFVIPRHVVFPESPPDPPSDPIDISQKRKGEAA